MIVNFKLQIEQLYIFAALIIVRSSNYFVWEGSKF